MRKKGFTLIELLVVIAIIAMLLSILMPALNKVKQMAMRVICGTNMKGLGTAHMVYSSDYEDQYAVQGGKGHHPWADRTNPWDAPGVNWALDTNFTITVGSSLFLLVREADVNPKSFVCPASNQEEYDGTNEGVSGGGPPMLDLVEMWDFGHIDDNGFGPGNSVSYAYHMPYGDSTDLGAGRYAASGTSTASFAIMADKNPWQDRKLMRGTGSADTYMDYVQRMGPYYSDDAEKWEVLRANSQAHNREGQNVLFGDGHSEWTKVSDVGVKHDNIYTPQGGSATYPEDPIRGGFGGADFNFNNNLQPETSQDSLLVNDDVNRVP
jgi:prepilin-type N-terminal cleavage/methylation domain-containing protein